MSKHMLTEGVPEPETGNSTEAGLGFDLASFGNVDHVKYGPSGSLLGTRHGRKPGRLVLCIQQGTCES